MVSKGSTLAMGSSGKDYDDDGGEVYEDYCGGLAMAVDCSFGFPFSQWAWWVSPYVYGGLVAILVECSRAQRKRRWGRLTIVVESKNTSGRLEQRQLVSSPLASRFVLVSRIRIATMQLDSCHYRPPGRMHWSTFGQASIGKGVGHLSSSPNAAQSMMLTFDVCATDVRLMCD